VHAPYLQARNTEVENEASYTVVPDDFVPTTRTSHKTVSLPATISVSNSSIPMESSSCRRSSRLMANAEKYLIELEDNPRKKQRVWREVSATKPPGLQLLDNPPRPDDEEILLLSLRRS